MKLSRPLTSSRPAVTPHPYATAAQGQWLWTTLREWVARDYPYTDWNWTKLGLNKNTLRAKLYGGAKWLAENGTEEQKSLAKETSFSEINGSFVLTRGTRKLPPAPSVSDSEPSPVCDRSTTFGDLREAVLGFMATAVYDGKSAKRPAYKNVSCVIEQGDKIELTRLVSDNGQFGVSIVIGRPGSVLLYPFSDEELGVKQP